MFVSQPLSASLPVNPILQKVRFGLNGWNMDVESWCTYLDFSTPAVFIDDGFTALEVEHARKVMHLLDVLS